MINPDHGQKWLFEQTPELISFFLGVLSTYFFVSYVFKNRIKSLEENIEFLRNELVLSEERCRETTDQLNRVIRDLSKRVNTLEDSRAFILQNNIKEMKKSLEDSKGTKK